MKTLCILLLSVFLSPFNAPQELNKAAGNWEGTLALPGGQSLKIVFHVMNKDGELSATMDSPDQNAFGLKMDEATFKDNTIKMTMNQIQGTYEGTLKDEKFIGKWSQSGQSFDLNLTRIKKTGDS